MRICCRVLALIVGFICRRYLFGVGCRVSVVLCWLQIFGFRCIWLLLVPGCQLCRVSAVVSGFVVDCLCRLMLSLQDKDYNDTVMTNSYKFRCGDYYCDYYARVYWLDYVSVMVNRLLLQHFTTDTPVQSLHILYVWVYDVIIFGNLGRDWHVCFHENLVRAWHDMMRPLIFMKNLVAIGMRPWILWKISHDTIDFHENLGRAWHETICFHENLGHDWHETIDF